MIYSYTQISHYLRCPRLYRYRYLDGWQEKDTRATMVFGRCFEKALGAYFHHEDSTVALYKESAAYLIRIRLWNTAKAIPGTDCCSKASICCTCLRSRIAFASRSLTAISSLKSPARLGTVPSLWPLSMPSATLTASAI